MADSCGTPPAAARAVGPFGERARGAPGLPVAPGPVRDRAVPARVGAGALAGARRLRERVLHAHALRRAGRAETGCPRALPGVRIARGADGRSAPADRQRVRRGALLGARAALAAPGAPPARVPRPADARRRHAVLRARDAAES